MTCDRVGGGVSLSGITPELLVAGSTGDEVNFTRRNESKDRLVVNIFVGNLPYSATDQDLREAFGAYGQVSSASVIMDKFTGKSRGFGFVEMPNRDEALNAIAALNDKDLNGRAIRVNEAQPREGLKSSRAGPARHASGRR